MPGCRTAVTAENIPPILVLGVGNILMKDEGLGVHAARRLQHTPLPTAVEVLDGGTAGMDLLYYLEGRKKVILIDAIQTDEPPGTIFRLTPGDMGPVSKREHFSLHQPGIFDVLRIADILGKSMPEVVIFAVQPADISMGTDLTPVINDKIPGLLHLVLNEIEKRKELAR